MWKKKKGNWESSLVNFIIKYENLFFLMLKQTGFKLFAKQLPSDE